MDVKQEKLRKMSGSSPNRSTATEGRDSDRDIESCFQAPMARIPSYRVTSVTWAAWVTLLTVPSTHAWPSIASGDHTIPLLSSEAAWQWFHTDTLIFPDHGLWPDLFSASFSLPR